ncbi:hypothetical protein C9374_004858 [Naegleria lovaniensis]|uniref:Dienelactone hydrolase domain-containing protein n=1 Tax=Naegleria lovaniensis TaxID=51637 RepID=A0AA88GKY7_NAELO|nr:uncharacterized protein C9374_004858 [Naegleria lovaniensis]KAG2382891.1 hypothetical protein C9374_004858 [Naegleria lovaniensis]
MSLFKNVTRTMVDIKISQHSSARAILHHNKQFVPHNSNEESQMHHKVGVVFVAGVGSGVLGPCGSYQTMSDMLAEEYPNVYALRVDMQDTSDMDGCVKECLHASKYLAKECGVKKVIYIGWSFGGAVVIRAGVSDTSMVAGVVTLATQTYGATSSILKYPVDLPILFIHGTQDTCLSFKCSKQLFEMCSSTKKELQLVEGDNHGFTNDIDGLVRRVTQFCKKIIEEYSTERAL